MHRLWAGILLISAVALANVARAREAYFVSERLAGNIWRLEDSNADGDALDLDERVLWGTGFAGARGMEADGMAIFVVEEGLADGSNQIVRLFDENGDGDALDAGERIVWLDGLDDPRDVARDADGAWYVSEFDNDELWRLADSNGDGDVLDISDRTLYAQQVDGPQKILPQAGSFLVPADAGDQIHRLLDNNGDGDALDIAENLVITPKYDQLLGLLDDGDGGFFFSSFSADTVYHARDRNGDGDMLDLGEVLSYADAVFGGLDGPWNMVAYETGGFLLANSNGNEVLLVRDQNGDGDALDLREVAQFAVGIDQPVDLVAAPFTLAGDYNGDGAVDAADYVVWRKTDDTQQGYDDWRASFGVSLGNGSLVNRTVPEPASQWLLILGAAAGCWRGSFSVSRGVYLRG